MNTAPQPAMNENSNADLDFKQMANAIRALSMDAVQAANSGHPGMPMGMADVATVLYSKFLKFDPANPEWPDRDRFILSGGHGSMLLYAINYLTGYEKMTIDQIRNFRQFGYITAGHPEVEPDAGIEITTGPLGQGIASAAGFALTERILNAHYGNDLVSHYTYTFCGDGDLQEGISHEACSLAGTLKLGKLIVLYDDNGITIDGKTELSFTDDTAKRFEAYGWDVQKIDGHDTAAIEAAIARAQTTDTPSLICCKTEIGHGAPNMGGTAKVHGSPLGADEIAATRENIGWPYPPFEVPEEILSQWRFVGAKGSKAFAEWSERFADAPRTFKDALDGDVTAKIAPIVQEVKKQVAAEKPSVATRQASGNVLEKLIPALPNLIGGSADLTGSVNTKIKDHAIISAANYDGQYVHYGVREHGMAAIMNGMALHGGVIPYSGTFLQFSDYCRPSIRLSALMEQRVIYVMTHDSIGLGEDGPTHQPVEHLAALRAMPNLLVMRPCDQIETAECWEIALQQRKTPSVLSLTRQGLPTLRGADKENLCARGAYILEENGDEPDITLFASGSEVSLAKESYDRLSADHTVRLVSVPCMELFWEQEGEYIQNIICNKSIKVAVEAAVRQSWDRFIGPHGIFIGMSTFGASAPAKELYNHFGITADAVVEAVKSKF